MSRPAIPISHFTAAVLKEVVGRGCHLCEVGIPYSDPIADGPVIQASYTRALAHKIKLADILKTLGEVAPKVAAPLVTMVSYAIVYRHGLEKYVDDAAQRGLAGLIVPDLPVEESAAAGRRSAGKRDVSLIQLVTPTTPRERAVRIAETSTGFLYYVSVAGITGERTQLPPELVDNVGWLRTQTDLPICIGFGISTAGAREAARPGGRRPDRRLGHRAANRRPRRSSRAKKCCATSATTWPSCSRR